MRITTIQVYEDTRKKLEQKKRYSRESYNAVLNRMLESEKIPSMHEMFTRGDKIKQTRKYATREVIRLSHRLRRGR